jgi:small conductance mechanosensitive channel
MNITQEDILAWLLDEGVTILIIIAASLVAYRLLTIATSRLSKHIQSLDDEDDSELDRRTKTIFRVIHSSGAVIIVSTALITILNEVGIPVGPLLASVGVVGLALGLGAQTLVRDVISGLFILIENQYTVNDVVELAGISGTVEEMNLRVTKIRDVNGTLHMIPNGEIRVVANKTRDWSRAVVNVGVTYDTDVDKATAVLQHIGQKAQQDPETGRLLLETPVITGVEDLGDWAVQLRLMVKTQPGTHWQVMRWLRREIHLAFAKEGIDLAFPRQDIMLLREDKAAE